MPCYHPTEISIKRKSLYPSRKYASDGTQVVPCGNCIGCRAEQARQWAVRMMHETRMHQSNLFLTLTLDDENLNENRELCPDDFSGFIKGLRKTQPEPISFFGCGEYGEKNQRPHYHAMLFGIDFLDKYPATDPSGRHFWRSETLEHAWGRGITEIGTVTMASASYVAGYIRKKVSLRHSVRANPLTGELLQQEFARMSLRPAIARRWIQRHWKDVYPRDFVVIDGKEAKPPRYYDKFMDLENVDGGTFQRRKVMDDVRRKRYDEAIEMTAYQLKAGEAIATSRTHLFSRRDRV